MCAYLLPLNCHWTSKFCVFLPPTQSSEDKKNLDVGANLFVGNLDAEVDEKTLYDAFVSFGNLVHTPKVCVSLLLCVLCGWLHEGAEAHNMNCTT